MIMATIFWGYLSRYEPGCDAIYVFLFLIGGGELLGWEYLVGPMRRRFVSACGSGTLDL